MSKSTKEQLDWMLKEYEALKQERDALKAKAERVPLTDGQLMLMIMGGGAIRLPPGWLHFARAIEAAHGITPPAGEQG